MIVGRVLLKYGFHKSFQKDEPLTSWTLFQQICLHFWVGLMGAIANPTKSEDKYVVKVFNWSEVYLSEMTCYKFHALGIHTKGKSFASVSLDPFLECRTNFWAFGSGQQQTLGRFFLWVWLTHLLTWLRLSDKLTQKSLLCLQGKARQLLETFSLCTIVL